MWFSRPPSQGADPADSRFYGMRAVSRRTASAYPSTPRPIARTAATSSESVAKAKELLAELEAKIEQLGNPRAPR